MATLDCVHLVLGVESAVRDSPELLTCVMYLLEEVVPSHHKWRYSQPGLMDRMGELHTNSSPGPLNPFCHCLCAALKLLDVVGAALLLRDSPLGQYVAHCLLYTSTGISLLNYVAMGAAAVEAGAVR